MRKELGDRLGQSLVVNLFLYCSIAKERRRGRRPEVYSMTYPAVT